MLIYTKLIVTVMATTLGLGMSQPVYDHGVDLPTTRPLNIAHRGSSGTLPEHTLEAYSLAIDEGADVVECDVAVTRDLQLVCLHESWMSPTTNVAEVFPGRNNTYFVVDQGRIINDYFSVDFDLAEIRLLGKRQRNINRDKHYDDLFAVPTVAEMLTLIAEAGRPVGVHLETKDPIFTNTRPILVDAETTMEDLLVEMVGSFGYLAPTDPCFLQSFGEGSLLYMSNITQLPLVKLIPSVAIVSDEELSRLSGFAYGIGPDRQLIVRMNAEKQIVSRTDLIERAHAVGLHVHTYTLRNENEYLAWDYGQDPTREYDDFLQLGVDGVFTDFPGTFGNYLDDTYIACK